MSYFAKELEAIMAERKINSAAEISKISGVDQATLSRVRSGTQKISHEDLDRVAKALGAGAVVHARLLRARLLEELRPPGGGLIDVTLHDEAKAKSRPAETAPDFLSKMPPKVEKIFRTLAEHSNETELRNILGSLASLYEKGSLA